MGSDNVGVCLDTCHVYDAGYDIVHNLDGVLEEFDRIIGLEKLKAIHTNDSMNPMGAHKDRHAKIGEGHIGFEALMKFIKMPQLEGLPINLETPNEIDGYAKEIAMMANAVTENSCSAKVLLCGGLFTGKSGFIDKIFTKRYNIPQVMRYEARSKSSDLRANC